MKSGMALMMAAWIKSSRDAAAQKKLLAGAGKLAEENADSEPLTQLLFEMGQRGPASPELADRARGIGLSMKTHSARMIKEEVAAQKKLRSMANKPLTIEGARNDETRFSTADWKGRGSWWTSGRCGAAPAVTCCRS